MSKTYIPEGYHSELTLYETQNAIGSIHHALKNIWDMNTESETCFRPSVR